MATPLVPTIGNAETVSAPWTTVAVAEVPAVGPAGSSVTDTETPLTTEAYVVPEKMTVLATVNVPGAPKVCVLVM